MSTELRYTAERAGDRAGLVAMQSDEAYLFFGVQWVAGRQAVTLSVRKNGQDPQQGRIVASAALAMSRRQAGKPVNLKLSIKGGVLSASYATRRNAWKTMVTDMDARFLSTKHAGGFVGTVIGLYNERAR